MGWHHLLSEGHGTHQAACLLGPLCLFQALLSFLHTSGLGVPLLIVQAPDVVSFIVIFLHALHTF